MCAREARVRERKSVRPREARAREKKLFFSGFFLFFIRFKTVLIYMNLPACLPVLQRFLKMFSLIILEPLTTQKVTRLVAGGRSRK